MMTDKPRTRTELVLALEEEKDNFLDAIGVIGLFARGAAKARRDRRSLAERLDNLSREVLAALSEISQVALDNRIREAVRLYGILPKTDKPEDEE